MTTVKRKKRRILEMSLTMVPCHLNKVGLNDRVSWKMWLYPHWMFPSMMKKVQISRPTKILMPCLYNNGAEPTTVTATAEATAFPVDPTAMTSKSPCQRGA